jgi:hypothetical protein
MYKVQKTNIRNRTYRERTLGVCQDRIYLRFLAGRLFAEASPICLFLHVHIAGRYGHPLYSTRTRHSTRAGRENKSKQGTNIKSIDWRTVCLMAVMGGGRTSSARLFDDSVLSFSRERMRLCSCEISLRWAFVSLSYFASATCEIHTHYI